MSLNIKDAETERLAAEVAALTHESKTRAVRVALQERRDRITAGRGSGRALGLRAFLISEAWPQLLRGDRGETISKAERESILGYGPEGV